MLKTKTKLVLLFVGLFLILQPALLAAKRSRSENDKRTSLDISGEAGDFIGVLRKNVHIQDKISLLLTNSAGKGASFVSPMARKVGVLLDSIGVGEYLSKIKAFEPSAEALARLLQRLENAITEKTGKLIIRYIRKHPRSPTLVALHGLALFEADEFTLSVRELSRATALSADRLAGTTLLRRRAVHFNETDKSSLSARAWLEEFLRQEEKFAGRIANLLGRAHFDLGNWKKSVRGLENAVQVDPQVPEAYEWLARAYDRNRQPNKFFDAWAKALDVNPWASDRNVWPVFCMTINHNAIIDTPRLNINQEWGYVKRLERLAAPKPEYSNKKNIQLTTLTKVIKGIRQLECTPSFVADRNQAMHDYHDMIAEKYPERDYTFINFAYGMVFFHTFHKMFVNIPMARDAIMRTQRQNLKFVHLGSNVGTETLYAALTWGVDSVGYDVLCNLVSEAKKFKAKFGVTNAEFHCMDALESDLSDAGVVWIDNQSWDEDLTNKILKKLANELPIGSVVIEYAASDYHAESRLKISDWLEARSCASLDVSWDNQEGTTVTVYGKRPLAYTTEYNRWDEYNLGIRRKLDSVRYMIEKVPSAADGPMQWEGSDILTELKALQAADSSNAGVFTTQVYTDRVLELFQRTLFNWYCKRWYNLHTHLLAEEIEYMELFFKMHGREYRAFNLDGSWIGNRMSSYTYSHSLKVGSESVDSSRFRVGTVKYFSEFWAFAKKILDRRGIALNPYYLEGIGKGNFSFHGLGWDIEKDHFKVYLMYHDFHAIPKRLRDLTEPGVETLCLPHGLISFTYKNSLDSQKGKPQKGASFNPMVHAEQVLEEKVIVYPRKVKSAKDAGLEVPSYTGTLALMFSSERGMISLYDLERGRLCAWRSQFPSEGLEVADAWSNVGLPLETISYQTSTEYSMYFPSGSG